MRFSPIIAAVLISLFVASCTKTELTRQTPLPGPGPSSRPPVAIAEGTDTVFLPLQQYISVNGYKSFDSTRTLQYRWRQIAGPASLQGGDSNGIANNYKVQLAGTYEFELTVTDNLGAAAKDSVKSIAIFESICSPQRTLFQPVITEVTKTPDSINEGSVIGYGGPYIIFTQGFVRDPIDPDGYTVIHSDKVHMFNPISNTWKTAKLSEGRMPEKINSNAEYIVFVGGQLSSGQYSTRIDIFHIATEQWSFIDMPERRRNSSVGIIGQKLVIAGGRDELLANTDRIDIYDLQNDTWQVYKLSEPRSDITVINDGQRLHFGGGSKGFSGLNAILSDKIDVYDPVSGRWSVSTLSEPKAAMLGAALNNKIYWAGGVQSKKPEIRVEIKDAFSNTTEFDCLGEAGFADNSGLMVFQNDNQSIGFAKQGLLNIFEPDQKKWAAAALPMQAIKAIVQINRQKFVIDQRYEAIRIRYHISKLEY